jgi:predicted Zn-dependent protease
MSYYFYGVCLHELGHFIGLNHTTADSDLMFWTANGGPISIINRQELWKTTSDAAVKGAIYSVKKSVSDSESCSGYSHLIRANTSCINSTGVYEVEENNNFVIYPNPSNGTFTIESPINDYTLVVSNMLGQRLFTRKINEDKAVINLSIVANGMYFIQEQYNKGIATQKLIITK